MGVEVITKTAGDGKTFPQKGQELTMHYTGTLKSDGSQFDSSRSRGRPFKFVIGIGQVQQYASTSYCISVLPKVIKGWDEGVAKMSLGEKARLEITSDYGYGANGAGDVIPPNADLVFDVELLAIGTQKASNV